jgi:hypothetical protein
MQFPAKLVPTWIGLCSLWFSQAAYGLDPANPAATRDARCILNYLNTLSGHHDHHTILGP